MMGRCGLFLASALVVLLMGAEARAERRTMVVHLPEAPIESASRVADGVTQLARYVQTSVPDLELEVKAFRKSEDALTFLAGDGDDAALVLCDAPFLLDLPEGYEVVHRFVRAGREMRRKVVVVKTESGIASLADLKGRSLTVTLSSSASASRFLAGTIFRGEIDPARWFGEIAQESDDFTATAAVLFGRTNAALVSEDNPLVVSHLGKDLTQIYTSAPVSLSVVAVRVASLRPETVAAVERVLDSVATQAEAKPILEVLDIDGFRRVDAGSRRIADFLASTKTKRELEIAVPAPVRFGSSGFAALAPAATSYVVGVELGEVTIPPELIDSVLSGSATNNKKADREP